MPRDKASQRCNLNIPDGRCSSGNGDHPPDTRNQRTPQPQMAQLARTIARSAVLVGAVVVVDLLALVSNFARNASGLLHRR
jgi:hypothetical protein